VKPAPKTQLLTLKAIGLKHAAPPPGEYTASDRSFQTGIPPARVVLETERGYLVEDGDLRIEIPRDNIAWIIR
jgi:hypothetical protein